MYPAILILPIESIYGIPNYAARKLPNPTIEAEPSILYRIFCIQIQSPSVCFFEISGKLQFLDID
jgi:hypothetical protein